MWLTNSVVNNVLLCPSTIPQTDSISKQPIPTNVKNDPSDFRKLLQRVQPIAMDNRSALASRRHAAEPLR